MKLSDEQITINVSRYGDFQLTSESTLNTKTKEYSDDCVIVHNAMIPCFAKNERGFLYPTKIGYKVFRPLYIKALKIENDKEITIDILDENFNVYLKKFEKVLERRILRLKSKLDFFKDILSHNKAE